MPQILATDAGAAATTISLLSDDLVKAFGDCLTAIGGDVTKFIVISLPVGLGIFGLFKAVRLGMNFFNSIAN